MPNVEQQSQLKFDLRLDSTDGKAAHRIFKGTCFLADGSLAVAEVKSTVSKVVVQVLHDRSIYPKPGGGVYGVDDVHVGARLTLAGTAYVVSHVDGQNVDLDEVNIGERAADPVTDRRLQQIRDKMRLKIKERGAETIQGLGRHFRILNDDGDSGIDQREFAKALREYGFSISDDDVAALLHMFDRDGNGRIDYNEFLRAVRGDMNEFRKGLVLKAFKKLDATRDGVIKLDDIKLYYNAKMHPDVVTGRKTEDQALNEWLDNFDSLQKDGVVEYEEFLEYYSAVSVSIDSDEYFATMMQNAWHIL